MCAETVVAGEGNRVLLTRVTRTHTGVASRGSSNFQGLAISQVPGSVDKCKRQ